jgi:hypothetical protein
MLYYPSVRFQLNVFILPTSQRADIREDLSTSFIILSV